MSDSGALSILCEDGPLLAVNKPAGLLTQSVAGTAPSLEQQVKEYLRTKHDKPGNVYLGVPHRLDRPVSGVVVFAKNSKVAARLAEQFRERQVRKWYLAVVEGNPVPPVGNCEDWLLKDAERAFVSVVPPEAPGAKLARLSYEVLATVGDRALLRIELHTGRMHQIRVQLSSRGWPIVGDEKYASTPSPMDSINEPAMFLHARQLELKHPIRYDALQITAPLPAAWSQCGFDLSMMNQ